MKTKTRKAKKQSNILSGNFDLSLKSFNLELGGKQKKGGKAKGKSDKVIFGSSAAYLK